MNPLSFVSFFTVGELGMMSALTLRYLGGFANVWRQVAAAQSLLFWLLAAGFVWVVGDIFQQYAVKYIGVSRGIPLSNSNQLWGLLWGAVAFGEFRGWSHSATMTAVYGSIVMTFGLVAISFATADHSEHRKWRAAAGREQRRYSIDAEFIDSGLAGTSHNAAGAKRWADWVLVLIATGIFVWTATLARWPAMNLYWPVVYVLIAAGLILFAAAVTALWKVTRFN